jgi:PilZ domain-containing protein
MAYGARGADRVAFSTPLTVHIMSIDGTWRRTCQMLDVSSTGARLLVEGSLEGLQLKEFFLLLSSTGLAYRRCEMIRINGDEMGLRFLEEKKGKKRSGRQETTTT